MQETEPGKRRRAPGGQLVPAGLRGRGSRWAAHCLLPGTHSRRRHWRAGPSAVGPLAVGWGNGAPSEETSWPVGPASARLLVNLAPTTTTTVWGQGSRCYSLGRAHVSLSGPRRRGPAGIVPAVRGAWPSGSGPSGSLTRRSKYSGYYARWVG